jgi:hypothetical protein
VSILWPVQTASAQEHLSHHRCCRGQARPWRLARPLGARLPSEVCWVCTAPAQALGSAWSYQLNAHSTAWRSSSCAEFGRLLRVFIWHPECMRRAISSKAEQTLRCPASASISSQVVSRTPLASLTRLRCGSCQAKSTISQCWSSRAISLAYTSHKMRHGVLVRHSSMHPSDFHSLERSSICQRSRSSTSASSKRSRLDGTSVSRIVQSASRKVSSDTACPRRCASRVPCHGVVDRPPLWARAA